MVVGICWRMSETPEMSAIPTYSISREMVDGKRFFEGSAGEPSSTHESERKRQCNKRTSARWGTNETACLKSATKNAALDIRPGCAYDHTFVSRYHISDTPGISSTNPKSRRNLSSPLISLSKSNLFATHFPQPEQQDIKIDKTWHSIAY